jgi:hypothetical protein
MKLPVIAATTAVVAGLVVAPQATADNFTVCPSGMSGVVTDDTSCQFADNVRYSWYAQPGMTITAFSPVTGETYTMQCAPAMTDVWGEAKRCVGVNDTGHGLIVYIS